MKTIIFKKNINWRAKRNSGLIFKLKKSDISQIIVESCYGEFCFYNKPYLPHKIYLVKIYKVA
jgi:hypothetical protein